MINRIKYTVMICLMALAGFTGCADDKDANFALPLNQGEVTFQFVKNTIYSISELQDMKRIRVTVEKDGKTFNLPTADLNGSNDSLSTPVLRLEEGAYKVTKYLAYDKRGNMIQEAYVDEENIFEVKHGEVYNYYFPIEIRVIYSNNQIKNVLYGLCNEVFGADSTKWPKTWREENTNLLDWENLYFEQDDYGQILYLKELHLDAKFQPMKKLPDAITRLVTLESLTISDIPAFEELSDELWRMNLLTIHIFNTSLKSFPKRMEDMPRLTAIVIHNSQLSEIPTRLGKIENLVDFCLRGHKITEIPQEFVRNLKSLLTFEVTNGLLTKMPENLFASIPRCTAVDFSGNANLNTLPEKIEGVSALNSLVLDDCGFTTIPAIAKNAYIRSLYLTNNKISSVTEEDVNDLNSRIRLLDLSGNPIASFPKMKSESLEELYLKNCGLTELPDVSALPNLLVVKIK